jgi:hypothetical protein
MDFKTRGATADPTLHPLWVAPEPLFERVPIGPATAQHILGQQATILMLGRTLQMIVKALDDDEPDHAAWMAREMLAELRRVLAVQ